MNIRAVGRKIRRNTIVVTFLRAPRAQKITTLVVIGAIIVGGSALLITHALTAVTNVEAESGTLSSQVTSVADTSASGGRAIKFGSGAVSSTYPTSPPVQICGNSSILNGPATAPAGAITVPAGDNSSFNFSQANKTFYFSTGRHTIGTGQFSQIIPGSGSTYIGAPGAILDGQNVNNYAFTQTATNVTIKNLEITGFKPPSNEGAVNGSASNNWTISNNYIHDNIPGTAIYAGTNNVLSYNCITKNGQEALGTYTSVAVSSVTGGAKNITFTNNEVSYNNTCNWEADAHFPVAVPSGCAGAGVQGCGCSGGIKFWTVDGATITDNYVHDNYGVAIWADTNNTGFDIEHNYVSNNFYEGIVYEISYNFLIKNNNFIGNAIGDGSNDPTFPHSAVYISESGSDSRVPGAYGTVSQIIGNNFSNNWGGAVLWEGSNRYCSSSANTSGGYCTLVNPSVANLTNCADSTKLATTPYIDDCRWKTQNVSITNNKFSFTASTLGPNCISDNRCGFNALFSVYGTYPPYQAYVTPIAISNNQNNHFANNTYTGPWSFLSFAQGDTVTWSQWTSGWQDSWYSGTNVAAQDAGSTLN